MKHFYNRQKMVKFDGSFNRFHEWGLIDGKFVEPESGTFCEFDADDALTGREIVITDAKAIDDSFAYTGKDDINGEKIWEGSIVELDPPGVGEYDFSPYIAVVEWQPDWARFVFRIIEGIGTEYPLLSADHGAKVIGNTSEDPEMMEDE